MVRVRTWVKLRPRLTAAAVLALCAAVLVPVLVGRAPGAGHEAEACAGKAAISLDCQRHRYATIVRRAGVGAAFADLKRRYEHEGFVRAGCHPIVHTIGHAAVDRYGDLGEAYARGDSFCSAGYFHGATERVIQRVDRGELTRRANRLCGDLGGHRRHSIYHRNCAHGLGHGFMLVRDYEVRKSLTTCDALRDAWEQRSCYGGVFMENVMSLGRRSGRSEYLRPDDPLYPCPTLERRYREMCYQKQTGYALFVNDDDFGSVFGLCAEVEKAFRAACNQGLGTNIAVHNLKRVVRERQRTGLTAATCMAGPHGARANCIKGAVRALINYDHDVRRATALCRALVPALRARCHLVVEDKRTWPE
jgi:hypothetical protein